MSEDNNRSIWDIDDTEESRKLDKRTLIILARDLLREASDNQDDPLYEIVRRLETEWIEKY